jgi:hypothetical protein
MIGKQVLQRSTKEALDRVFAPAVQPSLTNFTILEQALFALNLTKAESDSLEDFLNSPVFENFTRGIGLLTVTEKSAVAEQQAALAEFLGRVLDGRSKVAIDVFTSTVVDFIEKAAEDAWRAATDAGLVGPTWNSDAVVQSLVADQISNARRQLEQRIATTSAPFREVEVFADRYRRALEFATSKLKPQSIHESPSVPIGDLYVEPWVTPISDKGSEACSRDILLASSRRSVLLGNPGGGKSTLAAKLCHDICAGALDQSNPDNPELAAQVILRDYAQYQKINPCSIVDYLEVHSKTEYQIDAPSGAFKLLLLSGRLLIIFDGLDELIETKDRLTVRSAVEHFSMQYPVCAILVTSREVGYEQAPLDRAHFSHYKLSPFDSTQVQEYSTKWFRYSCFPQIEEGKRLAKAFAAESAIVPDITSNPLMLGLMCNLYRQDGFIPKNRPEVYQRCADLLFTKWDRGRGIRVKLPLDHRVRPAMSHLAYWIYSDEKLQVGVTEDQLITATSAYLRQWVEDDAEANQIAHEFISFFSGRAWVFTDTGSDKTQRLYQFTHRTFLEYFTADELVRLNAKAEDLHDALIERITGRSWDVVCQLAFQLTAQRSMSHDILMDLLCRDAHKADLQPKLNILSFLARTMDLLYPTPPARRRAVRYCVETVFGNLLRIEAGGADYISLATEIMGGILSTTEEVLKINASEISATLMDMLGHDCLSTEDRIEALLLSDDLSVLSRTSSLRTNDSDRHTFWRNISDSLAEQLGPVRAFLARHDPRVALESWWRMEMSLTEIVGLFGARACFDPARYPLGKWFRTPIGSAVVEWSTSVVAEGAEEAISFYSTHKLWIFEETQQFARVVLRSAPWRQTVGEPLLLDPFQGFSQLGDKKTLAWPVDQGIVESVLVSLAVLSELQPLDAARWKESTGVLREFVTFFFCRVEPSYREHAHRIIEERCSTSIVKETLHQWIDGRFAFIEVPSVES